MQYGTVTGRFLAAVADTPQDADTNPDEVPLQGTVTFTPSAAALKVAGQGATILPVPIAGILDADGYLTLNGVRGVTLIATDTDETNPRDFTYRVTFSGLNYGGVGVSYQPFSIQVPAGQTIDLAVVAPVAEAKGAAIVRGEKGDPGAPGGTFTYDPDEGLYTAEDADPIPAVNPRTLTFAPTVMTALGSALRTLPPAADAAGAVGVFSADRHSYNFKPSNTRRLRAALGRAKAGTGTARLGMCGDSTTAGFPSDPNKGAPAQMRSFLERRGYDVSSTGPVIANPGGAPGGYRDPRFSTTGAWTTQANNPNGILQSTESGATITFSSDFPGTAVEISYLDLGAGWSYSIDGAPAVAVPPSGGSGSIARVTVSDLPGPVATVVITVGSVPPGGAFYLNWVSVRRRQNGLEVGNFGVNSTTTADWNNDLFYFPRATLRDWVPDAVFIDLGINDWGSTGTPQTSPDTFRSRTQALIDTFKPTADVILVTSNPFEGVDYLPYNAVKYALADSNDLPLVDVYELFESYAVSQPLGLYADSAHPSLAGYAEKGSALANVLP